MMRFFMNGLHVIFVLLFVFWLYLFLTLNNNDLTCSGFMGTKCPLLFSCNTPRTNLPDEQGKCVLLGMINIDSQKQSPTPDGKSEVYETIVPTSAPTISTVKKSNRKKNWMKMNSKDYFGNKFEIEYPESWDKYRNENNFHIPCIEGDTNIDNICISFSLGNSGDNESILKNPRIIIRNGFSVKYIEFKIGKRNFLKFAGSKDKFTIDGVVVDAEKYPNFISTIAEMVGTYEVLIN